MTALDKIFAFLESGQPPHQDAGIFGATGQSCVAGSRLYLHEDIATEFLEKMTALARNIQIGDPLTKVQDAFPDIAIGSYPKHDSGRFWTDIVLRGSDEARLAEAEAAVSAMIASLGTA